MADVIKLGNATRGYLDLNDKTKHQVAARGIRVNPTWHHNVLELPALERVQYVDEYAGELVIALNLMVAGSSREDLATNWQNIALRREDVQRYLRLGDGSPVQLEYRMHGRNSDTRVFYQVVGVEWPPFPDDGRLVGNKYLNAILTLRCWPWARDDNEVTATGTLTHTGTGSGSPSGISVPATTGDVHGPARVLVQNWTSGAEMRYLSVAGRTRGNVANFIDVFLPGSTGSTVGTSPHQYSVTKGAGANRVGSVSFTARVQDNGTRRRFRFRFGQLVGGVQTPVYASGEHETTATWTNYTVTLYVNPYTHLPFTEAELIAGSWGIENVNGGELRVAKYTIGIGKLSRNTFSSSNIDIVPDTVESAGSWTHTGGAANLPAALADVSDTTYALSSTASDTLLISGAISADNVHRPLRAALPESVVRNWSFESTPAPYSALVASHVLTADDFEGAYSSGAAPGWNATQANFGQSESAIAQSGTAAQALLATAGFPTRYLVKLFAGFAVGTKYRMSIWMRVSSTAGGDVAGATLSSSAQPGVGVLTTLSEAGTTYVEKTYDFIAPAASMVVWLHLAGGYSGVHNALFDNLTFSVLDEHPADWAKVGNIGGYKQGALAQGWDAFTVGLGDVAGNYYTQTINVVPGATYRAKAAITGGLHVTCYSAAVIVADLDAADTNGLTFVPGGSTLEMRIYSAGTTGTVDALRIVRIDQTELVRLTMSSTGTVLADQVGEFLIRLRCKSSNPALAVRHRYGGSSGTRISNKLVTVPTSVFPRLLEVGVMKYPAAPTPYGVALGSLVQTISIDWSNIDTLTGPVLFDLDWVERIPIDEGLYWEEDLPAGSGILYFEYFVADSGEPRGPVTYRTDGDGNILDVITHGGTRLMWPKEAGRAFITVARARDDHRIDDTFIPQVNRYGWVGHLG